MKSYIKLLTSFVLISCISICCNDQATSDSKSEASIDATSDSISDPSDSNKKVSDINRRANFKIIVLNKEEAGIYKKLVYDADSLLNIVFNLPEFKSAVLSHQFDWVDLGNGQKDSLTNAQVWDSLFTNKEANINLYFKRRKSWNVIARMYGTVGKTTIGSNSTTTYSNWIDLRDDEYQCTLRIYASHIAHEYCHQRGFFDKNYDQDSHRDVVPYAIGDIVCSLLNKNYQESCECDK